MYKHAGRLAIYSEFFLHFQFLEMDEIEQDTTGFMPVAGIAQVK